MGMAASQVRFLTLQDRKSTIGMRLGILSNRKMALTRDMNKAAREYNDAYTETKLQWYDSINGNYTDITYNAMMSPNAGNSYTPYIITDRNTGRVILDGITNVAKLCDENAPAGVGNNMVSFMEDLVGTTNYIPGTMTYNEEAMAPSIIMELMGITDFDPTRKIYKGVENVDLKDGGWEKVDHSDLMEKMTVGIGTLNGTTASVVPVWEIYENRLDYDYTKGSVGYNYDLLTGNGGYNADSAQHPNTQNNTSSQDYKDGYNFSSGSSMYLDSSGNAHTLTGSTYWKTLYENGAVIISDYTLNTSSDYYGADYSGSLSNLLGTSQNIRAGNLYKWVHQFVSDVNDQDLFKYDMTAYIDTISMATTKHLRSAYYGNHENKPVSDEIYVDITKTPDTVYTSGDDSSAVAAWHVVLTTDRAGIDPTSNKTVWDQRDIYEYNVYSPKEGDPVPKSGTTDIGSAIAHQANASTSVVLFNSYDGRYKHESKTTLEKSSENYFDEVAAISVKNVLDVALYYIQLAQERLAANQQISTTNDGEDLYGYAKEYFNYAAFNQGNNPDYCLTSNYNQGEMEVFTQGETRVASVYSMLSNLKMLAEKVDHCGSLSGTPAANIDSNTFSGFYDDSENADSMKQILENILATNNLSDAQLIALANFNAWICQALDQDYSTSGGVDQLNEYLNNALKAAQLFSNEYCKESEWGTAQGTAYIDAFYYDKGVDWNRREQLFSQSSEKKVATSQLDIEGQLTVLQLKQFKFYVNLVKECLARGWKDASNGGSNSNVDNNSTTLHLQNGTWLINDSTAKSSSRIFEVNNKEAREEALSKYEALQSELKMKEERIDIQMDKLETEQNAINTELDSLQSIISDNIKSTFKIFS